MRPSCPSFQRSPHLHPHIIAIHPFNHSINRSAPARSPHPHAHIAIHPSIPSIAQCLLEVVEGEVDVAALDARLELRLVVRLLTSHAV